MNNFPLMISGSLRTGVEEYVGKGVVPVQALVEEVVRIDDPEVLRGVSELLSETDRSLTGREGQGIVGAIDG